MRNLIRQLQTQVFGYDFFISYRHNSAGGYAANLAQSLEERGYAVFIDRRETPAGSDLPLAIRWALWRAKILIPLLSHDAPNSEWMRNEISQFLPSGRTVLPIDFASLLSSELILPDQFLALKKRHYIVDTTEHLPDGKPTTRVLDAIVEGLNHIRVRTAARWALAAAATLLVIAALIAPTIRELIARCEAQALASREIATHIDTTTDEIDAISIRVASLTEKAKMMEEQIESAESQASGIRNFLETRANFHIAEKYSNMATTALRYFKAGAYTTLDDALTAQGFSLNQPFREVAALLSTSSIAINENARDWLSSVAAVEKFVVNLLSIKGQLEQRGIDFLMLIQSRYPNEVVDAELLQRVEVNLRTFRDNRRTTLLELDQIRNQMQSAENRRDVLMKQQKALVHERPVWCTSGVS
ncbi:MAG: hypothetical protein UY58_C0012G0002 [Candidatus Magasanikbacteria bacterium GW2011_GWA2_50_22]|uniref:TIR domain-containing protein n=1 Tax=Candidatus Magasanikbacteria bacterium GW2011_GWA2_50_22 TaxID=1619043 RepID=A0A0G1YPY8_9BACT|nr:MAG: hypothetical protein UY58_C0012G0002 [Candidatus Magasanikbacteria bacterium GW2011_GWA2_50_22]